MSQEIAGILDRCELDEVCVDAIDCIGIEKNGKPTIQYIFAYRCFCGVSAPKGTMYAHLVNEHKLPAGVIQMVLNMSPVKQESVAGSDGIKS